jgi:hypothetical protein
MNHCFTAEVMSITYSECVSVAIRIQHALRMTFNVLDVLLGPKILVHVIS